MLRLFRNHFSMNRTERFYLIDQLLHARKLVTRQEFLDELEISWATLKRDLATLRGHFNAPIVFDGDLGGYRFANPDVGPKYELPGLWFSAEETYALLTMHHLLSELEPGLLAPHVAPLLSRLEAIMGQEGQHFRDIAARIRLAQGGGRRKNPEHFAAISRGVIQRLRLRVRHYNRADDTTLERDLSPQRLVYYRNNWYLEAWCHQREALRRFSVDAIQSVELLNGPVREVPTQELDRCFGGSYGIYGGEPQHCAVLCFSKAATRWVADEEWHPQQAGEIGADGRYTLKVPYADPTELMMDILRHGKHVDVLAPPELRESVGAELTEAVKTYLESSTG
jgi:predicted DNA-binding transcriptional regulator YafY